MFSYKIHRSENDTVLAVADSDIVGKKFSRGGLEINVSREFYSESEASESVLIELMQDVTIVNAIGERAIAMLVKNKLVDKADVANVCGLPHAQIICL